MDPTSTADDDLSHSQRLLLVAEYESCTRISNHIDNVRNVLTSFYLTIAGSILVLGRPVLNDEFDRSPFGSGEGILAAVLFMISVVGTLFVATIARLRRVQTERYGIANAILDRVMDTDVLRKVIALHDSTLPEGPAQPFSERGSGSYFWTLIIIIPNAAVASIGTFLVIHPVHELAAAPIAWIAATLVAVGMVVFQDRLYHTLRQVG